MCIIWFTDLLDRKKENKHLKRGILLDRARHAGPADFVRPWRLRRAFVVFSFFELALDLMKQTQKRNKTNNAREGWEDGTPPPHRDFKERGVVR